MKNKHAGNTTPVFEANIAIEPIKRQQILAKFEKKFEVTSFSYLAGMPSSRLTGVKVFNRL
jgi:hypothetical protein